MAFLFNDASSHYLEVASTPVTAYPFSMSCWFNCDDASNVGTLMGVFHKAGTSFHRMVLVGTLSPKQLRGNSAASAVETNATVTAWSANTWHHACYVCASSTSRSIYLDNSKVTDTTSSTPASLDNVTAGGRWYSSVMGQLFSGHIAETALWNVALSDADVNSLYQRYSPQLVRRESLVWYHNLIGDANLAQYDGPLIGSNFTTANGPPTKSTHIQMIYPRRPRQRQGKTAVVAATNHNLLLLGAGT